MVDAQLQALDELVEEARRKWVREQGGVVDDVTVLIACPTEELRATLPAPRDADE